MSWWIFCVLLFLPLASLLMTMSLLHYIIEIYFFCYIVLKWKQALVLLKLLWGELPREQRSWQKVDMRRFSWIHLRQFQRRGFWILMHVIYPRLLVQLWEFCMYPPQRLHILVTILFRIEMTTKQNGAIIRYVFYWDGQIVYWVASENSLSIIICKTCYH